MSETTMTPEPSQDDIEMLLPWLVTGKLDAADKLAVERYLETHPAMRAQLDLIEAEQEGTTANNEAIDPPRADQMAKLMASIGAAEQSASPLAALTGYVQRALDWLSERSALVPVATAAAVILMLQAGVIGEMSWRQASDPGKRGYQTASVHAPATSPDKGTFALAGFVPAATAEQIEHALGPLGIVIVDGPKAGGIYKLRLADKPLGDQEREIVINALKAQSGVVRFVAPANP